MSAAPPDPPDAETDPHTSDLPSALFRQEMGGAWSLERAQHELEAETAAHWRQLEAERIRHELYEAVKDNERRRQRELVVFYVVVGVLVGFLVVGLLVGTRAANDETRAWAQGIVTLILGGVVGGLAGYMTGRSSR